MRYFLLTFFLVVATIVAWAGFRGAPSQKPPLEFLPDMDHQAKIKTQAAGHFFADGMGSRAPTEDTMPMGWEVPETPATEMSTHWSGFGGGVSYAETGIIGDYYGDGFPKNLLIDAKFLERGRQRYTINCAVCHGAAGDGKGITHSYGIMNAASFTDPLFWKSDSQTYRPDGAIFYTITHGKGLMGPYGGNITIGDRWAIVAYIRALQLATSSAPSGVPAVNP